MKTSIITLLFLVTTNVLAVSSSFEQQLVETVTETYKVKNGIYKRIALKRIGSEKLIISSNGEEYPEILNEFLGEEELIGEKYLVPLQDEVKFKTRFEGTDEYSDFNNEYSLQAKIKVSSSKIQGLLVSEQTLTNHFKEQFEGIVRLQASTEEISEENVQLEFLKVKTSGLKCLPKNGKLYCQYKLKVHAKAYGENK